MSEALLTILKFCFLALLYLFLFRVVRVVLAEMRAPVAAGAVAVDPSPGPAPRPRRRGDRFHLEVVDPPDRRGERFEIGDELTVGRGGGCGIVLADDSFVSQVHARVYRRDGQVYVEDLGSRNGTVVNGSAITTATRLRRRDRVQFGRTVAELVR